VSETWFIVFIGIALAGLIGLFLYGWRRRNEKPPPGVKPLKDDDDDWGRMT
jgi:LPXTG-motif cell wall-anchored protein